MFEGSQMKCRPSSKATFGHNASVESHCANGITHCHCELVANECKSKLKPFAKANYPSLHPTA